MRVQQRRLIIRSGIAAFGVLVALAMVLPATSVPGNAAAAASRKAPPTASELRQAAVAIAKRAADARLAAERAATAASSAAQTLRLAEANLVAVKVRPVVRPHSWPSRSNRVATLSRPPARSCRQRSRVPSAPILPPA